jgi:hypothetical protein
MLEMKGMRQFNRLPQKPPIIHFRGKKSATLNGKQINGPWRIIVLAGHSCVMPLNKSFFRQGIEAATSNPAILVARKTKPLQLGPA